MSKRLEILKQSLKKKETEFSRRVDEHFKTVAKANGQPLNDKRNGRATLNEWERQDRGIANQLNEIEKTKEAIEREEMKIARVENEQIPSEITALVESGVLVQWRKYPNYFFVKGVEKARIIWLDKTREVAHKYASSITDPEQRKRFAEVYNGLNKIFRK